MENELIKIHELLEGSNYRIWYIKKDDAYA